MSEVSHCPFCGSSTVAIPGETNLFDGAAKCVTCGATGPAGKADGALVRWNQRALPRAPYLHAAKLLHRWATAIRKGMKDDGSWKENGPEKVECDDMIETAKRLRDSARGSNRRAVKAAS